MNKLLRAARTRAGIVVSTAGLVLVGGGVATAAVISSPAPDEAQVTTTEPVETTAPTPVEAPAPAPVEPPVAEAPAATVEDVTEPEAPAPAPTRAPAVGAPHDASTTWVEPESGATYLPAPEVPPAKLESEVGYGDSGD